MAVTVGYYLSGVIALAIVVIGARFLIAPRAAAAGYGLAVTPDQTSDAFLSVKGIRDVASGLLTAVVMLNRSAPLLGWFLVTATIIPLADTIIVLRHGGPKATAFGIHGSTALLMLLTSSLLLLG
jgi:hypothetical protein